MSYALSGLLDKMTSNDKDYRFMACNDLKNELEKPEFKLDGDSEFKVMAALLKLLDDSNGEVQNLVSKCLPPLVHKVRDQHVEDMVDRLCTNMLSAQEQLRDISSIALKKVIAEISPASAAGTNMSKKLTSKLIKAVGKEDNVPMQLEVLDILTDVISRFGAQLGSSHSSIQESLFPLLQSQRAAVRKRVIVALGHLVPCLSETLLAQLVALLSDRLQATQSRADVRTYIQAVATISRHAGGRLDKKLDRIFPRVLDFANTEGDDELKEYCFQALESFVLRCPKEIEGATQQIVNLCTKFLQYDPNYNYDDEEENSEASERMRTDDGAEEDDGNDDLSGGEGNDDDDDDAGGDDEYSDDEDLSWKVRRSAVKCLNAVVQTRPDLLSEFLRTVTPLLISRFKEREQNVQSEIFACYISALRSQRYYFSSSLASLRGSTGYMGRTPSRAVSSSFSSMDTDNSISSLLRAEVPLLVKSLSKMFKSRDVKTRQNVFAVLHELVSHLPFALQDNLQSVIPGIKFALTDSSSTANLKIEVLQFMELLFKTHLPETIMAKLPQLLPLIVQCAQDSSFKIVAEALTVCVQCIGAFGASNIQSDTAPLAQSLFSAAASHLGSHETDQEVKERAIIAIGDIISNLGNLLPQDKVSAIFPVLQERLKNESVRLVSVRAFTQLAKASSMSPSLSSILTPVLQEVSGFLRKNNRSLRVASLEAINAIFLKHSVDAGIIPAVVQELRPLISDSDLHITQLAVGAVTAIVKAHPESAAPTHLFESVLSLLRSPLLQGGALDAVLALFAALAEANQPSLTHRLLIESLIKPIYVDNLVSVSSSGNSSVNSMGAVSSSSSSSSTALSSSLSNTVPKQAFISVAKCVGAVCKANSDDYLAIVSQFAADVQNQQTTDGIKFLALLSIGEIGKYLDLSSLEVLQAILVEQFASKSEDIKSAASYSLGNVAVGNLALYLPFLLEQIQSQSKRQYLLFHSLKEIISCQSLSSDSIELLRPFVGQIWSILFEHSDSKEEGTRNVVAECLGKLTLLDPATCFPELQDRLSSASHFTRATVVIAVKFTISDSDHPADAFLRNYMERFLSLIQDKDFNVRRVALVTFNSAAHNKPILVRDSLSSLLPALYGETKVKPELIREVEMGPFKHKVDDGLDLRKAAFECMYTLLESCLDRVNLFDFLTHVLEGLKDQYDIKLLCHLILSKLTVVAAPAVLQRLDELVEPLQTSVTSTAKANTVKQEVEKNEELVRSALRSVASIAKIPESTSSGKFSIFFAHIQSDNVLRSKYESCVRDDMQGSVFSDSMDLS